MNASVVRRSISKLLVVGGSASGASAGARARRLSEECEITIFERTPDPSFSSCGMPYYLGEEIEDRNKLLVTPLPLLENGYNFDLRCQTEVVGIDPNGKVVKAKNLVTGETYQENYDKLILSLGASPFVPPIQGIDSTNVFTLNSLGEMDDIYERTNQDGVNKVCVVGGGFIGLEVAEQLKERGLEVHLLELEDQLVPPLDKEMAAIVCKEFKNHGVQVHLSTSANKMEFDNVSSSVRIEAKSAEGTFDLEVDLVVLATGVVPNSEIAKDCGIFTNDRGLIQVDEHMRTNFEDIYACGDLVEINDYVFPEENSYVPLANVANMHGRIAANHIFGMEPDTYKGTTSVAGVKVFGLTVAMMGWTEKRLNSCDKEYIHFYTCVDHRPEYMNLETENLYNMAVKVLMDQEGGILGCQIVGEKGVDTLGNIMALAMSLKASVFDLESAEFLYCPFGGHARGNANQIGMIGAGILRGTHKLAYVEDLFACKDQNVTVVDIRPPPDFEKDTIPSCTVNVPLTQLRDKCEELFEKDENIIVSCGIGKKAYWASRILQLCGFQNAKALSGSYHLFKRCYKEE